MTTQKYIEVAEDINDVMDKIQDLPEAPRRYLLKEEVKKIAINRQVSVFEVIDVLQDLVDTIAEALAEDQANRTMLN